MIYYYWVAFYGIFRKEIKRFMRIWIQTLLPPAITTMLYFLVFGTVMGPRIGDMEGFNYTVFITPGLIMLAVIVNSYSNVVSSFYGARFVRSIEELLVSPVPNWLMVAGFSLGGVTRGVLTGLIVFGISRCFVVLHIEHLALSLLLLILCSTIFALAGLLNGIFAKKFDDLVVVPTFILTPLIYLGGVFFSINSLRPIWQKLSYLNPVHYLIDLFRYSLLGIHPPESLTLGFSGIVLTGLIIYSLIMYLLQRGQGLKT